MSKPFDPYYQWLGIGSKHQPPDHYRLLGIELFESDEDVIANAADRQAAHVGTYQTGKHAHDSQRLLSEISAARVCLLDPARKAKYDAALKAEQCAWPPKATRPKQTPPKADALPVAKPLDEPAAPQRPAPGRPMPGAMSAEQPPLLQPSPPAPGEVMPLIKEHSPDTDANRTAALPWVRLACVVVGGALTLVVIVLAFNRLGGPPVATRDDPKNGLSSPPPPAARHDVPTDGSNRGKKPPRVTQPDGTKPDGTDPKKHPSEDPSTHGDDPPDGNGSDPPEGNDPGTTDRPDPVTPGKPPVPDAAAQKEAEAEIRDIFDFEAAKTVPDKAELARELIRTATETHDSPAARYVMLRLAGDLAAESGFVREADYAVHELETHFAIDAFASRTSYVAQAAQQAEHPQAIRDAVEAGIALIDKGFKEDRVEETAQLIRTLYPIVVRMRDSELNRAIIERRKVSQALVAQHQAVQEALQVLKANPDDPDANLAVGKFYCLFRDDFKRGLPLLAKGSDPALKRLAELELAKPETLDEEMQLADGWWETAENAEPGEQEKLRGAAGYWYRKARPKLTSALIRLKIDKRLERIKSFPKRK